MIAFDAVSYQVAGVTDPGYNNANQTPVSSDEPIVIGYCLKSVSQNPCSSVAKKSCFRVAEYVHLNILFRSLK